MAEVSSCRFAVRLAAVPLRSTSPDESPKAGLRGHCDCREKGRWAGAARLRRVKRDRTDLFCKWITWIASQRKEPMCSGSVQVTAFRD